MSYGRPTSDADAPISLVPEEGWHCSHLYYRFDRGVLAGQSTGQKTEWAAEIASILDPKADGAPERLQTTRWRDRRPILGS